MKSGYASQLENMQRRIHALEDEIHVSLMVIFGVCREKDIFTNTHLIYSS